MNLAHAPVILDVAGLELDDDDRRRLAHPLTGGIVLFARNWRDRLQLTELIAEMKSIRTDLLVCVDHEGGRVQRFRSDGFTALPPMRVLGEMWMDDGDGGAGTGAMRALEAARATGHVLAAELRACGVDLSFTPVLDLDHGGSGVIGDRAFHRDPRVVSMLARGVMHGLLQAGMHNCGKHFPGHGFVRADSHHEIPVDERPLDRILADDARPYEWLGGEHVAGRPRRFERTHGAGAGTAVAVVHPHLAEDAHRRQRREAVAAEALDATTLVIDADEQVVADGFHLGDQLGQLKAVAPIAREQDDPAGERMGETAAIVGVEGQAGDVEDDRRMGEVHRGDSCSTTTKLAA